MDEDQRPGRWCHIQLSHPGQNSHLRPRGWGQHHHWTRRRWDALAFLYYSVSNQILWGLPCHFLSTVLVFSGAPGPPGEPFISRYGTALTLHWTSGDQGRAPITRYVIEARPSGGPITNIHVVWVLICPPYTLILFSYFLILPLDEGLWDILIKDIPREVTSYTLNMDMLREGVTYDFRVIAVNDYGYGSPSAPSPSISGRL